jgi:hypothetical protein
LIVDARSQEFCDYQACKDAGRAFAVPVVGPILGATTKGSNVSLGPDHVLWSLAQGAGLAMFVAGIVGRRPAPEKHAMSSWAISPVASHDTTGFILRATF